MDEILYLEPDEEITSVIDKLKKTNTQSVGLVIPRNSTLIHSIVNLKLIQREAESLNKEIALVTGDKIGKNIASQIGLRVYEDVHAKRPVSVLGMPELPRGDEVIEVDMSASTEATPETPSVKRRSGLPQVRHYDSSGSADSTADDEISAKISDPSPSTAGHVYEPVVNSPGGKVSKGTLVFVGLFIFIIAVTLLGLPQSSILVTVAAESFEKTLPVSVDKMATNLNTDNHSLPGKLLEVNNDDARRIVSTGKKDVGGKAKGSVTISNAWDSNPLKIASGTVFTTPDGKAFALDNDTNVPGVTLALKEGQLVTTPGTTNATITASSPGDTFNVKPGKFVISGLSPKQQEKIFAENSKDFSGGFTKQVSVMTQSDIDTGKDTILQDLNKEALEQLKKESKGQKLLNEAVLNEVTNFETNPAKADSETDFFDIKVKARHRAMVFDDKIVQQVVDSSLKKEVPADKELLPSEGDEFVVSVIGQDYDSGKLELESKIKTKIGTRVVAGQLKRGLAGKNEVAIRSQLTTIPNVKEISLRKFPSWWWQDTSYMGWNTHLKVIYE